MTVARRSATVLAASVMAFLLLVGAAAWACTVHTGTIYFCSSSAGCSSSGFNPGASASAWMDGSALIASTQVTIRYAATSSGVDACHTGTSVGSTTTNIDGNITTNVAFTTPAAGNWTFCATNGTGDNYSDHLSVTLS